MGNLINADALGDAIHAVLSGRGHAFVSPDGAVTFMEEVAGVLCKHVGGGQVRVQGGKDDSVLRIDNTAPAADAFWSKYSVQEPAGVNPVRVLMQLCYGAAHPIFTKKKWEEIAEGARPSDYWTWVERNLKGQPQLSIGDVTVTSIFKDLLTKRQVFLNGRKAVRVQFRADLSAQEVINEAPPSTQLDDQVFSLRPDLFKACLAMAPGFTIEAWYGRTLYDFASEYALSFQADTTPVLELVATRGIQAVFTMDQLWNAAPAAPGAWQIGPYTLALGDH